MGLSWDLSPIYQTSKGAIVQQSNFVAFVLNDRLVIRDQDTLAIVNTFKLPNAQEWNVCANDECVAVWPRSSSPAQNPQTALVFSVHGQQQEPVARIELGIESISHLTWFPNEPVLMSFSSAKTRCTLYDMTDSRPPVYIDKPKWTHHNNASDGYSFRPSPSRSEESLLALIERHEGKDSLGIYSSSKLLRHVPLSATSNTGTASDDSQFTMVDWSPCGRFLLLLSTSISPRMCIVSPDGRMLFDTGKDLQSLTPVVAHAWHPSGDWLVTVDWAGTVSLRFRTSWMTVEQFSLNAAVTTTVHREPQNWREQARGAGVVRFDSNKFQIDSVSQVAQPASTDNNNNSSHHYKLAISPNGLWLTALSSAASPRTIHIYEFSATASNGNSGSNSRLIKPSNAVVTADPIRTFAWQPNAGFDDSDDKLVVVSGADRSFVVWRPTTAVSSASSATETGTGTRAGSVCEGIAIPTTNALVPHSASWDTQGRHVLLTSHASPPSYLIASVAADR